jgi:hypothetical protein
MTSLFNHGAPGGRLARASALCLLALAATLLQSREARAQWTAPDTAGNISTTNTGNVGVGTSAPASRLDVLGTTGLTVRTGGASAGFSIFDRPSVPGDQLVFQGNTGNYTVINTATRNANFGSEKGSGFAMWTVDNAYTPNATQFQLQNSPSFGGVVFTQKFGTGAQGDKKVSFQSGWNQLTVPTQFVLDTTGSVGVGTATPGILNGINYATYIPLHVKGGAGGHYIAIDSGNSSAGIVFNDSSQPVDSRMWSMSQAAGSGKLTFSTHADAGTSSHKIVFDRAGNVGVGTSAPVSKLHVAGNITVDGNINAKYQDVAEWVPSTQKLIAGTVVVLDTGRGNHVLASAGSYDTRVAGVISAQPGLSLGEAGEGKVLVATTGRVKVKVDATGGAIRIGDLIVTSNVEGVAMRSEPVSFGGVALHRPGTIIGKALESLEKGTGEILVLLSLQ